MGNMHTPSSHVKENSSFCLTITAAATNGAVVDTQGFENALVVFHTNPSGAGTTSDCKVQEGDAANLSDAADVATATFTQGTTAGGRTIQVGTLRLAKRKRYLRLVHTGAGAAAAGAAAGEVLLFNGRNAPVSHGVAVAFTL